MAESKKDKTGSRDYGLPPSGKSSRPKSSTLKVPIRTLGSVMERDGPNAATKKLALAVKFVVTHHLSTVLYITLKHASSTIRSDNNHFTLEMYNQDDTEQKQFLPSFQQPETSSSSSASSSFASTAKRARGPYKKRLHAYVTSVNEAGLVAFEVFYKPQTRRGAQTPYEMLRMTRPFLRPKCPVGSTRN